MLLSLINKMEKKESFANSFIMTAMRLEALSERYLFKPLGLTSSSFNILAFIQSNKSCSPIDILHYLGGTKSNVTQRLAFLERQGLVVAKKLREGDKRKIVLDLTPAGKKKMSDILAIFKKNSIHIDKFFTKSELLAHLSFMSKLNKILDECEKLLKAKHQK